MTIRIARCAFAAVHIAAIALGYWMNYRVRKSYRTGGARSGENSGCMNRLAIAVVLVSIARAGFAQGAAPDPDRLYADRARLSSALEAATIWEARLMKDPRDFESAWKLARTC